MEFFEQYSYKQKNLLLLILSALLLIVCYKRAISITLDLMTLNDELKVKTQEAENSQQTVFAKQKLNKALDRVIGKENVPKEKVQQSFVSFFEMHRENVQLLSMEEPFVYIHPDFNIYSHRVILEGGFNDLHRLINDIEEKFEYAQLLNVTYQVERELRTKSNRLQATLILQNYDKK